MGKPLVLLILAINLFGAAHANFLGKNIHAQEEKGDLQDKTISHKYKACVMSWYTIHIISAVDNLAFRCQSKDDDLGMVIRNSGETFEIKFCLNIWKSTLFFCHFYWEWKQVAFVVFKQGKKSHEYCFSRAHGFKNDCYWMAREDGFYIPRSNNPPDYWVKKYDWW